VRSVRHRREWLWLRGLATLSASKLARSSTESRSGRRRLGEERLESCFLSEESCSKLAVGNKKMGYCSWAGFESRVKQRPRLKSREKS
jgi:hypothetical protein